MNDMVQRLRDSIERTLLAFSLEDSHAEWTDRLIGELARLGARSGFDVRYSNPAADVSEWLYDLVWRSEQQVGNASRLTKLELAMESEWGKSEQDILYDFQKLVQSRAALKLMVCLEVGDDIIAKMIADVKAYPGIEKCTYIMAVCSPRASLPAVVRFAFCDEVGNSVTVATQSPMERYLRLVAATSATTKSFQLDFDGFWPDKPDGFVKDRMVLYFVFAGRRVPEGDHYVADLHRLIYIGSAASVEENIGVSPNLQNVFRQKCESGEIPYFAFARVTGGDIQDCMGALIRRFKPVLNGTMTPPQSRGGSVRIMMAGAVAYCLGDREFVV